MDQNEFMAFFYLFNMMNHSRDLSLFPQYGNGHKEMRQENEAYVRGGCRTVVVMLSPTERSLQAEIKVNSTAREI